MSAFHFVWRALKHEDLASINHTEDLPLAFSGHHPAPAKSTGGLPRHTRELGTQVDCLPSFLGPIQIPTDTEAAQWRTAPLSLCYSRTLTISR